MLQIFNPLVKSNNIKHPYFEIPSGSLEGQKGEGVGAQQLKRMVNWYGNATSSGHLMH